MAPYAAEVITSMIVPYGMVGIPIFGHLITTEAILGIANFITLGVGTLNFYFQNEDVRMYLDGAKELGDATGNKYYDTAKQVVEMASWQVVFFAMMNPRMYNDAKRNFQTNNESGISIKEAASYDNSSLLDENGNFKDPETQVAYEKYCERKINVGETPREPLDWKETSDYFAQLQKQGRDFANSQFDEFKQQYPNAEREITIVTTDLEGNEVRIRVDAIATDSNGNIIIQEYKSSSTAPFTSNQESGFPGLFQNGGTIVGEGKGEFIGGILIESGTNVEVVRPEGMTYYNQ